MKEKKVWKIPALVLAMVLSCTGVALASGGSQEDPLVTVSYLEQTVIPLVLEQSQIQLQQRASELEQIFADHVSQYRDEVQELVSEQESAAGQSSGTYTLVTLNKKQTLALDVGCELMLRVGSAKVTANTNPALIDISTGGTLERGKALTKNHLYMATIPDRVLTPTADTVKVLVRGGYTLVEG